MLAAVPGIEDLTLTTNGSLLARKAQSLAAAGLNRVTVSLDSMDDTVFQAMNDVGFPVEKVLEGIEAAAAAGLTPVKVNTVVQRGVNEGSVVDLARHFKGSGHILRFIEFMDVGTTNGWRMDDVYPADRIVEDIDRVFPLDPVPPNYPGEVANRYRYRDGSGEIGVIASVTHPFCGSCTQGAHLGRGDAVHLPLRLAGDRSAGAAARRRNRRGASRCHGRRLAPPRATATPRSAPPGPRRRSRSR